MQLGDRGRDVLLWQKFLIAHGHPLPLHGPDGGYGAETANATRGYQQTQGLQQTGNADGPTLAAARTDGFVLPKSAPIDTAHAGMEKWPPVPTDLSAPSVDDQQERFGPLKWVAAPEPGNPEAIRITNSFEADKIRLVTVPEIADLLDGPKDGKVEWNKLAEAQFVGLWRAWEKAGLLDRTLTWDGGYVPRRVRGSTTTLSNHAFGAAFDVNEPWNKLANIPALIGSRGSMRELVQIAGRLGFFWGGHYARRKDGMHFEVARILTQAEVDAVLDQIPAVD